MTKEELSLAFAQRIIDDMPEWMADTDTISVMALLVTSYADDPAEATHMFAVAHAAAMQTYHTEVGGECMCDECVAHRKQTAH